MKKVKAEIIAIGTELLLGQIANTNAQWLSEQLASYGIDTYYHTVVGDNLERVENTFRQAQARSNVIIVSGGLGPTEDDMTREAFQRMTHMNMVEHGPSMKNIEDFYARQHMTMSENNRRQARVFDDAYVIDNRVGMAPGMIVTYQAKTWIFLPGVPREMKQMCKDKVLDHLTTLSEEKMIIRSKVLRFIGIGESRLEHKLIDLIQAQSNPTIAPLAQNDGVVIRLTAKETTEEKAFRKIEKTKDLILDRVGMHFFGIDDDTIEEKVFSMLKSKNKRIAAAESITGGKFIERLISIPGASEISPGGIICYDSDVKINTLNIAVETINKYGAVSKECALEMAENICHVLNSNIGISFTGESGPNTLEDRPAGTVYIAIVTNSGYKHVEKFSFQGDRNIVRNRATIQGYELLFNYLKLNK